MHSLIRRRAVAVAAVAGLCLALGSIAVPAAQAQTIGPVLAWGSNSSGQLGNGTRTSSTTPIQTSIPAEDAIVAVSAGGHHSLALTTDGTVLAWGNNQFGQLGIGSHMNQKSPVTVPFPAGTQITAISAGYDYSLALTSIGQVYAWGLGGAGQLGDGSFATSLSPVLVDLPNGTTATAISAGDRHALAITNTGGVESWGENAYGQLGDGNTTSSDVPQSVSLPAGTTVTAVAAGGAHSLALTADNTVLAWGDGKKGQLGDDTRMNSDVPVSVVLPMNTTVTAIAAGAQHSLALTSTGGVLAWGWNHFGQLGDGFSANTVLPVPVSLPAGTTVTAIAAGSFADHSLAITSTGAILTWGDNADGQLGNGTTTNSNVPVTVSLPAGSMALGIAGGKNHSVAIVELGCAC